MMTPCHLLTGLLDLGEELWAEGTLGPKLALQQGHVLLGLRIECGVHNQAVDEHPQMVPGRRKFQ